MSEAQTVDVTEMTAVHRVLRDALSPRATGLVEAVSDGDTERAAVVGHYFSNVLAFLDGHHTGEDALLFPRLRERADDTELIDRMAREHESVHDAVHAMSDALSAWTASASKASGTVLVQAIKELEAAVVPHLDAEEELLLPLVAEHITQEEWDELPSHAMQTFGGDDMFLIIGLVREQFTPEQNDRMLEGMPPPAVEAWKTVGIESYKQSVAALVGGAAQG